MVNLLFPILILFFIGAILLFLSNQLHFLHLKISRRNENINDFRAYFILKNITDDIIDAVSRFLREFSIFRDIPIHPDDSLTEIWGMYEKDLHVMIFDLAQECGCSLSPSFTSENLETVEDLIILLSGNINIKGEQDTSEDS